MDKQTDKYKKYNRVICEALYHKGHLVPYRNACKCYLMAFKIMVRGKRIVNCSLK